ncbi:TRAP transporter large permease [Homoserinimonas sp. A447]
MSLLLFGILIVVLLIARVPVAFSLLGPSIIYVLTNGMSDGLASRIVAGGVNSFALLAVPLFILLGVIANRSGIADRIFDAAVETLGKLRGSLGYVNVLVSLGFSWMSGSALADAAGLGKVEVPAMVKRGYPRRFSVGVTAASALISPVMPPSIPAVIYASIAAVSTGALFAAAIVPAFLMAAGMFITVWVWARKHPELRGEDFNFKRWWKATVRVLGPLVAPIIILGGILGGFFTPTEAAGIGALYVLILGFLYRTILFRDIPSIFKEAAVTTASITLILGASALLGWILAREQVPQAVAKFLLSLTDNPYVFLLLVNLLLILLGMFIEPTSALVISVPILLPIAVQFGIEPVHFGVIVIMNLMIGLLTPPIGGVLFVLSTVTKTPIDEAFKGVAPFLIPLGAVLLIVTFVPALALFLPEALGML